MIIGKKGSGKSYLVLKTISLYVRHRKMPVLIIDQTGEYSNYNKIEYNPNQDDDKKRIYGKNEIITHYRYEQRKNFFGETRNIKIPLKTEKAYTGIYGIRFREPSIYVINVMNFDITQKLKLVEDIGNHFKNGMLVFEEMNSYIRRNVPASFYSFLTRLRHNGVDFNGLYQSIGDPHPDIYRQIEYMQLFKTQDSVTRTSTTDKITGGKVEMVEIAEIAIDKLFTKFQDVRNAIRDIKFKKQKPEIETKQLDLLLRKNSTSLAEVFFFCTVNFETEKISTIPEDLFKQSIMIYLNRHKGIVKSMLFDVDINGKRSFNNYQQAFEAAIEARMKYVR